MDELRFRRFVVAGAIVLDDVVEMDRILILDDDASVGSKHWCPVTYKL